MNIIPLSNNVLIEPLKESNKTEVGIYIPESTEKEKPQQGTVIAVGKGKVNNDGTITALSVKEGDKIIFNMYGPNEIKIDGKDYLIASENDILAIINNDK